MKIKQNHLSNLVRFSLAACVFAGGLFTVVLRAQDGEQLHEQFRRTGSYDQNPSKIYTGKSPFIVRETAPEAAPTPRASKPAPAPRADYSSSETCGGLVRLVKKAPANVSIGDTFAYDLQATAQCDAAEIVVIDTLPDGLSFVKSEPDATPDGRRLIWRKASMHRGETMTIKVWVKAEKEGEMVNCATVSAIAQTCISTMVGKPVLAIQKSGPETALLGADVTYNILVSNKGTTTARNVVVTDSVPEGLTHASGQKELSFNVGDLAPNQSKTISVAFKAAQRGKVCNVAMASSSNAGKADSQACTTIVKPGLKVVKTGDKEQFLNRNASYEIVVSNTGDTTLTGVTVSDTAPAQTSFVSADGAAIKGNTATWNVGDLKAGEQKTFTVKLTSKVPGNHCNSVTVSSAQGLSESAQACTQWKGLSAILLEKADDPDPIQIGEQTTYTVKVTNQGTADDENVLMVVSFPAEITPVSATGGGVVDGQTVKFPVVKTLPAKQAVQYQIKAKGAKTGDARVKFTLTSDMLKTPVVAEESTHVY